MVRNCKGRNKDGKPCSRIAGEEKAVDGLCTTHLRGHYLKQIKEEVDKRLRAAGMFRCLVERDVELPEDYEYRLKIRQPMVQQVIEGRRAEGTLLLDCLLPVL